VWISDQTEEYTMVTPADWFIIQKNVFTVALHTKLVIILLYRAATPVFHQYIQKQASFVLSD
jgi:hypothetical protein